MYKIKFWEEGERRNKNLSETSAYTFEDYVGYDAAIKHCQNMAMMFGSAEVIDDQNHTYFYAGWNNHKYDTRFTEIGLREKLIVRNLNINSLKMINFEEWTNEQLKNRLLLLEETFDDLFGKEHV